MPFGYLVGVLFLGACVLLQLVPIRGRSVLRPLSFWTSLVVNEQPHWFALMLIAATALAFAQGNIDSAPAWAVVLGALAVLLGLARLFLRMFRSRASLAAAIAMLDPEAVDRTGGGRKYVATLFGPFAYGRGKVERVADITYGPAGKRNLLDVYHRPGGRSRGPTLIFLHGGSFTGGAKKREGQLALYRLARRGWVCISANYRLSPEAQFPDYVIDLKRVIAWAKSEGQRYGVDPDRILLAGSSAGGHIAATAGLSENEPVLQPGFEEVDTKVAGVIGIYGYYGGLDFGSLRPRGPLPSSPRDLVRPGAVPFLITHGVRDTVVSIENARSFVARLRESGVPVAFAELPGAQHSFDLLRSVRNENSVDAIEDFAAWLFGTSMGDYGESRPLGSGLGRSSDGANTGSQ